MSFMLPVHLVFVAVPLGVLIIFGTAALCLRRTIPGVICEVIAHGGCAFGFAAYTYFIIPRFKKIFEDFGAEIPDAAKLVIVISDLTVNYWYLFPFLLVAGCVVDALGFVAFHRLPETRYVSRVFSALITLALLAQAAFVAFALFGPMTKLLNDLS